MLHALANGEVHHVPLFLSVDDPFGRQGFVRIINETGRDGSVFVEAIDETSASFGSFAFELQANQATHFNADYLAEQVGSGNVGHWRLRITSGVLDEFTVLTYARSPDGFLSPLNGSIAKSPNRGDSYNRWLVTTFNPASNTRQRSLLRITNLETDPLAVFIRGRDDQGNQPDRAVERVIEANSTIDVRSVELEDEWAMDGEGKWRLEVSSRGELLVLDLLEAVETGHIVNMAAHRKDVTQDTPVDPLDLESLGLPETAEFGPRFGYAILYSRRQGSTAQGSGRWFAARADGFGIRDHPIDWSEVKYLEFANPDRHGTGWAEKLDRLRVGGSVIGMGFQRGHVDLDTGETCWVTFQVADGTRIDRHVGGSSRDTDPLRLYDTFSISGLTLDPSRSSESVVCNVAPPLSERSRSFLLLPR